MVDASDNLKEIQDDAKRTIYYLFLTFQIMCLIPESFFVSDWEAKCPDSEMVREYAL